MSAARDRAWWPLQFGDASGIAKISLPTMSVRVHSRHINDEAHAYRVYTHGHRKLGGCNTLLELRALLLGIAYPEGNR